MDQPENRRQPRTGQPGNKDAAGRPVDPRYLVYLIVVATAGWGLASYDFNLMVLSLDDIAKGMHLSATLVGVLGFIVYVAELAFSLGFGLFMDRSGRRLAWMISLAGAACLTGLTYLVQDFWQLALVRALASGFAYAELAISVTLVNEELPPRNRGLYYSIVQGGWPLGVVLAAIVYQAAISLGWRTLFLFGVPPLLLVVVGRIWIREPERFTQVKEVRGALQGGDEAKAKELSDRYDIDMEEARKHSFRQLFTTNQTIRRQLILLSLVWYFYGCAYVATNTYIVYWLTHFAGYKKGAAAWLLLGCAAIGFFFYVGGGWLGERYSRRNILIATGALVPPVSLIFLFVSGQVWVGIVYFVLYQVTNGTWSGVAYTYNAESFPTRLRGTATGFLDAVQILGFITGAAIWTGLIGNVPHVIVWLVLAVALSCGQMLILLCRRIPSNQALEQIAR